MNFVDMKTEVEPVFIWLVYKAKVIWVGAGVVADFF